MKILVSFCNLPSPPPRQSDRRRPNLLTWLSGGHVTQLSVLAVVWGAVDVRLEIDVLPVAGLAPGGATRDGVRLARVVRQCPKPTES